MAFVWKDRKEIFKGEGIYHLTFVVAGRRRLFGELVPLGASLAYSRRYCRDVKRPLDKDGNGSQAAADGNGSQAAADGNGSQAAAVGNGRGGKYTGLLATVELSRLGFAVSEHIKGLSERVEGLTVCGKQIMPDHIHMVVWVKKDSGRSIRQIGNGFRIGVKRLAVEMGLWQDVDGHVLEIPFIRTLSHAGQLRQMIDYVHANPDNAWMRKMNPEMYVMRRNQEYEGLGFDVMGKARLLAYPQKNVVALSRSLTKEQIAAEVSRALRLAERGAVTYCAAMNDGERAVTRAIREARFPLVVMLLDGFPPVGSEAARFFHPGGAYHKACGEGLLCLIAPLGRNYGDSRLIELTELELARKAEEKGRHYDGISHSSLRWRMIAGNVMLGMIAGELV